MVIVSKTTMMSRPKQVMAQLMEFYLFFMSESWEDNKLVRGSPSCTHSGYQFDRCSAIFKLWLL